MFDGMFLIILILLALYLWRGALGARERARELGHEICAKAHVQLLDQTVALQHLGVARGSDGHLHLRRRYRFELSTDGLDRHLGSLELFEDRLTSCSLPLGQHDLPGASPPLENSNVIAFGRPDAPRRH